MLQFIHFCTYKKMLDIQRHTISTFHNAKHLNELKYPSNIFRHLLDLTSILQISATVINSILLVFKVVNMLLIWSITKVKSNITKISHVLIQIIDKQTVWFLELSKWNTKNTELKAVRFAHILTMTHMNSKGKTDVLAERGHATPTCVCPWGMVSWTMLVAATRWGWELVVLPTEDAIGLSGPDVASGSHFSSMVSMLHSLAAPRKSYRCCNIYCHIVKCCFQQVSKMDYFRHSQCEMIWQLC